jgi:hypothetical protein
VAALAARQVSEPYGRLICLWTNRLPEKFRDESDELLLAAAASRLGLEELAAMAAEMYVRARGDLPDQDPDRDFADRGLKLATTFGGAGVMHGDLTSECAAAVAAVLDALSAPAGKDDDRTRDQRYHDALQEAMRRLAASNLLPERAGQPAKIWAHISLADLLRLDGSSALQEEWTALVRARWAAHRAKASETGSDGGAWLDGDAAGAIACDAAMAPIVTGDLDPFHHQVVIHRWGWTLVLNPDGTTTAWNKNKTKVLHSHGPPSARGDNPGPEAHAPGTGTPEAGGLHFGVRGWRHGGR